MLLLLEKLNLGDLHYQVLHLKLKEGQVFLLQKLKGGQPNQVLSLKLKDADHH